MLTKKDIKTIPIGLFSEIPEIYISCCNDNQDDPEKPA